MVATKNQVPVSIEDEMKSSFMDYAMSVIVARALPDARDHLTVAALADLCLFASFSQVTEIVPTFSE